MPRLFFSILCSISLGSASVQGLEKGEFIEPNTPFLRSALTFEGHAAKNRTRRGVIIPLGHGLWTCFDPDLLRVAAIWRAPEKSPPISLDSMAAISYPDGKAKAAKPPELRGKLLAYSPELSGFSARPDQRDDPRESTLISNPKTKVGPLPTIYGRWHGLSVSGETTVISYRAADYEIHEFFIAIDAQTVVRRLQISAGKKMIYLHLDPVAGRVNKNEADIPRSPLSNLQISSAPGIFLRSKLDSGTFLQITPSDEPRTISIIRSAEKIPADLNIPLFSESLPATNHFAAPSKTTSPLPKEITTPIASRQLKIPKNNSDQRTIRPTDIAFLSDGTALLTTLDGDVWRISGIETPEATWTRCATGIFEATAIEISEKDEVFVLGRDQITELIDHNSDGLFDEYRCASDAFIQSLHTRDYAMALALAKDGSFYVAKGGIWDPGKTFFNELSPHQGSILHISKDGGKVELSADGLRIPYVGLDASERVFASDQQGNFIPSTPVHLIGSDQPTLGYAPTNHRKKDLTEPLLWFPYAISRSASGFAVLSEKAFPSLPAQMAQLSWSGRIFPLVTPDTGQSFAWKLPLELPFPVLNAATHPKTGHLFVVGLGISGYKPETTQFWGLAELWESAKFATPTTWTITKTEQTITFNQPIPKNLDPNKSHFAFSAWNIQRTPKYGSGHFRWNGQPGEHHFLPEKITLSTDRRTLTMATPPIFNSSVLKLSLNFIDPNGNDNLSHELYTTVRKLPKASQSELAAMKEEKVELKPGDPKRGKEVFAQFGCAGCHSLENQILTGPPLNGVASRHPQETLLAFLRSSIKDPAKDVAKGFEAAMPSFDGVIPDQDIENLVAYLQSLK